ncbi:MAG: adenosylcobinamide-phosphate synthase CbiB [Terracidiphilus sp.]
MSPEEFVAAYALDWCAGDPEWMPHPVRLIGWSIDRSERFVRRFGSGRRFELAAGGLVALAVPAFFAFAAYGLLRRARRIHPAFGAVVETWLAFTCLGTRNLLDEAAEVAKALERGDFERARLRLARVVGRDTDDLDEGEICRAVVETLAESLSDGVMAPLFYLALGGVPLAISYKAVNTLDSMIAHKNARYLYFGRVAARVDDAANYLPARIAALLVCMAAGFVQGDGARCGRTWLRDGGRHESPNAGQVEASMAGALGVRLGGVNHYGDETIVSPHLGAEFPLPERRAARRAGKVVALASLFGFCAALLVALGRKDD